MKEQNMKEHSKAYLFTVGGDIASHYIARFFKNVARAIKKVLTRSKP